MNKLQQLKAERARLYKELAKIKRQISLEQTKADKLWWDRKTITEDIALFLRSKNKFTVEKLADYPCSTVYLEYVRWTRLYSTITLNKFTIECEKLGIRQKLVRRGTKVYRVYCHNLS